jgi:hypothetical protein
MDVQFENRFMETDRMVLEFYRKEAYSKNILLYVIFAFIALVLTAIFLKEGVRFWAIYSTVVMLFFLGYAVMIPYLMLRRAKKNSLAFHNGKSPEEVVRFGDNIAFSRGTFALTLEYSQIYACRRLRDSWLLQFGKRNYVMLSPTGFTVGDAADFWDFIRNKCPNMKEKP